MNLMMDAAFLGSLYRYADDDVNTWIRRVEERDGQTLEGQVTDAINTLVTGIKADGDWASVVSLGVMNAARTLNGAAIAVKGPDVSSFVNMVNADIVRGRGVLGNGINKAVFPGINQNAFVSASAGYGGVHIPVWASQTPFCPIGFHTVNGIRIDVTGKSPIAPTDPEGNLFGNIGNSAYSGTTETIGGSGFGTDLVVSVARQNSANITLRTHPPTAALSGIVVASTGSAGSSSLISLMTPESSLAFGCINGPMASYVFGTTGPASIDRIMPRLTTFTNTLRAFFGN